MSIGIIYMYNEIIANNLITACVLDLSLIAI